MIALIFSVGHIYGQARNERLYPKDGRVEVSAVFRPKLTTDGDVYLIYIRKVREVSVKVTSNSAFIGKGNECGMYFRLFDDKGVETKIGDAPAGVDQWSGYVEKAGIYRIQIAMGCLEAITASQIAAKKPRFRYTLKIFQPPAPSR